MCFSYYYYHHYDHHHHVFYIRRTLPRVMDSLFVSFSLHASLSSAMSMVRFRVCKSSMTVSVQLFLGCPLLLLLATSICCPRCTHVYMASPVQPLLFCDWVYMWNTQSFIEGCSADLVLHLHTTYPCHHCFVVPL